MKIKQILFILSQIFFVTMSFVFKPTWQSEGKGAKVLRVIGNQYLKRLDPFLMLDFFSGKLPAGFPDHPHRGFETVTYMLKGKFYHQDFKGHKGIIGPGDLQWMTAGRGIVHSQMPASFDQEGSGFQLWINLKKQLKMIQPAYQQYRNEELKIIKKEKAQIKIISGKWQEEKGPILARTPAYYFDVILQPGGQFQIPIPKKWNTIIFVYQGSAEYVFQNKQQKVDNLHCCVLQKSDQKQLKHKFKSQKGTKFVLIGGFPLNQPIAQHGPFVMNTQQQIYQAFQDYQQSKNGFQGAGQWESKIKNLSKGKHIKYEEL